MLSANYIPGSDNLRLPVFAWATTAPSKLNLLWLPAPITFTRPPAPTIMDHELLPDTVEHRTQEHLKAGEVREARDLLVLQPAADRANALADLPAREMVGLFRSPPVPQQVACSAGTYLGSN